MLLISLEKKNNNLLYNMIFENWTIKYIFDKKVIGNNFKDIPNYIKLIVSLK